MRKLQELHPGPEPMSIPLPSEAQDTVPLLYQSPPGAKERLELLQECITSFKAGTAAGPSGLKAQHLQDLMFPGNPHGPLLALELDRFVGHCLTGKLSQDCSTLLGTSNLIALRKRKVTSAMAEPDEELEALRTVSDWCGGESRNASLWDVATPEED